MGNERVNGDLETAVAAETGKEVDYGSLAGSYLYFLAGLSIAAMILSPFLLDSFQLDWSPVFNIWAGSQLKRRSNLARWFVIAMYSLGVFLVLMAFAMPLLGSGSDLKISGASLPKEPLVLVPIGLAFTFLLLYPVVLLVSRPAREQIAKNRIV